MARARGYDPLATSTEQNHLLDRIVEACTRPTAVAIFDLDGCLFDTRPRQVQIWREYASRHGLVEPYRAQIHHIKDWCTRDTFTRAGVSQDWLDIHLDALENDWFERFFDGRTVRYDHAMPGAAQRVRDCQHAGAHIVYLTGRHQAMRAGTLEALQAAGFPLDGDRARLWTKPGFEESDLDYKLSTIEHLHMLGEPVLFLDNEPCNVNGFREHLPDALVVFVETDHSPRPEEPHPELPWLRSFLRTGES